MADVTIGPLEFVWFDNGELRLGEFVVCGTRIAAPRFDSWSVLPPATATA